jgi:CDP-glycerol glycerophosphotransferase
VYEALRARHPELKTVWSYAGARGRQGFPKDSELVRRESWRYYRTLARAAYWVDNYGFPKPCPPRRATTYVQTWHGTPLKMVLLDLERIQQLPARGRRFWQEFVDRWDYVVVPNDYYRGTFVRGSNTAAQEIRAGLPRNDVLVTRSSPADAEAVKRQLGIPLDRTVLLYTPTWRRAAAGVPLTLPNLTEMAAALGDEYYLLVRQHYYRPSIDVPQELAWFARDVSGLDETSTLLLAADVLVTDFSSVAFDYAFLGRPMIFYVPDYEFYTRVEPRTYINLAEVAPGPLVSDTAELVAAIRRTNEDRVTYSEAYKQFFDRYCAADNGRAGEIVVDRVWGPGPTG